MKILLVLIVAYFLIAIIFQPYIDITSNKDVVIWYNWKGKRIFKYLWKNEN